MLSYLSPTSFTMALADPVCFHRKYILGLAVREPQTLPMAIGAAFDAFLKGELRYRLYGETGIAKELLAVNVEPANLATATGAGFKALKRYEEQGGLAELMLEISSAHGHVRMESTVRDDVTFQGHTVPLLGKPDLYWYTAAGAHVVYDFKVNGAMSARAPRVYPGGYRQGERVATVTDLAPIRDWVIQCLLYGWVLGEGVGADTRYGIEQLSGPDMNLVHYRWTVPREEQVRIWEKLVYVWENRDKLVTDPVALAALEDETFAAITF